MTSAHERAVDGALSDDFDPVAAYADGYQQAVDPGWPSPDHIGTIPFEYGYIDGVERHLGDAPYTDAIERRLEEWEDVM